MSVALLFFFIEFFLFFSKKTSHRSIQKIIFAIGLYEAKVFSVVKVEKHNTNSK
jgi:hypothetical protein